MTTKRPPPSWLPEALAVAQVADKLKLSWEEAAWLRARHKAGRSRYHWRVIWLYCKSRWKGYKP